MEKIPRVGLGTWKAPSDEVTESVRFAIEEAGYRHVDCAFVYQNQEAVGNALQDILSRGVVKREELWITSKLWSTDHEPERVEAACLHTLEELKVKYLDLYLIHWPMSFPHGGDLWPFEENNDKQLKLINVPIIDTWKAMEKLVDKGYVRHIGVSNFTIELLEKLLYSDIRIKPFANQVEQQLFLQEEALIDFCEKRNIVFEGYRTLGGPASSRDPNNPVVLENPVLNEVAKETGRTPAQVELKFLLSLGTNSVVLAKSTNQNRIRENIDLDFELSDEQIQRLKSQNRCLRFTKTLDRWGVDVFCDHW